MVYNRTTFAHPDTRELRLSAARQKSSAGAKSVCPPGCRQHVPRLQVHLRGYWSAPKWRSVVGYKRSSMRHGRRVTPDGNASRARGPSSFRASLAYVILRRKLRRAPPKRRMAVTLPVRPSRTPDAFDRLLIKAEQRVRVHREHRTAEGLVPGKPIAKLEGQAQHPLPNRGTGEHVVDEMRRTLGHAAPSAAWATVSAFARKCNQPIGAAARTRKPGKAMREDAAANESLRLALHEQRGVAPAAASRKPLGRLPQVNERKGNQLRRSCASATLSAAPSSALSTIEASSNALRTANSGETSCKSSCATWNVGISMTALAKS